MSCPTHAHSTKSGKLLCIGCYNERRAKREAVRAEVVSRQAEVDTSFHGLENAEAVPGEISNEALTQSARKIVEPWQMSLYIALAGIGLGIVLLAFPTIRHVALGATTFPTGYLMFIFAVLSAGWAWVGMRNEAYLINRIKCFYGIGACAVCVLIAFIVIASAPTVQTAPTISVIDSRTGTETPEELKSWRERALRKYTPATQ
ncbi:MAG TPA: hypothetical protein PK869_17125 [Candidatus Hydrogenedentes bacterium]|nr:hypothetical protein [Candidatus Hydrogenedentota bacterium]